MGQAVMYLNGQWLKADDDLTERYAPGVLAGKGAFETMRVYNKEVFAFEDHWKRLQRGLGFYEIKAANTQKEIKSLVEELIQRSGLVESRVRLVIWQKKGRTEISIVCQPLRLAKGVASGQGFKALISKVIRRQTGSSHLKTLNYHCFRQAFAKARADGFDEAILLNSRGELVEGSRTNLFIVRKGILCTPALSCGCLQGITRRYVLACAREMGMITRTGRFSAASLLEADEAFLTNSILEIVPLTRVDQHAIAGGRPGKVTFSLARKYRELISNPLAGEGT